MLAQKHVSAAIDKWLRPFEEFGSLPSLFAGGIDIVVSSLAFGSARASTKLAVVEGPYVAAVGPRNLSFRGPILIFLRVRVQSHPPTTAVHSCQAF